MLNKLGSQQPPNGLATNEDEALAVAQARLPGAGAPVLRARRPRDADCLSTSELCALHADGGGGVPERPVLVDKFLEDATEVDVDCIADSETCVIGGVLEHIE